MKFIKQFINKNKLLFLIIGICLLANSIFSYSQGLQREVLANQAYIDLMADYPESIKSSRVEPLFIILSYYLSKLLNPLLAIASLKLIITGIQLFIFYKIINLLTRNNLIAMLFTVVLNFSFAFFSLYDNLLRNHFANMLFLIALFFILSILQRKTNSRSIKHILLASLPGGLLIYSHILPTLLFDFTLLITVILFYLSLFLPNKIKILSQHKQQLLCATKSLFLVGILTLIIQLPYIIKLHQTNVSTQDYKQAGKIINKETAFTTIATNKLDTISNKEMSLNKGQAYTLSLKSLPDKLFKLFRILFEFRLPGISILFIFLIAVSIIYLIKNITLAYTQLLILWIITYIGTKVDLIFGIGVIPYRFSLMLIFSSLLLLAILFNILINFVKSKKGQYFLIIIVLLSFMSTNLPLIINTTILKNYTPNNQEQILLKNIHTKIIPQASHHPSIFSINGKSFERFDKTSKYLRNVTFFTSFNEEKIIKYYNARHIDFVIFDHFKMNAKGSNLGATVNTNLEFYESSKYFNKLDEIINPYMHLSIFKYSPNAIPGKSITSTIFDCSEDTTCQQKFENHLKHVPSKHLDTWVIEITELTDNTLITESISTDDEIVSLVYTQKIDSQKNKRLLALRNIVIRKNLKIPLIIQIPKAKLLLHYSGFTINRKELQKLSINELTIFGEVTSNLIQYSYINTTQLKVLTALMAIVLILLFYIFLTTLEYKKNSHKTLMQFKSTKEKRLIRFLVAFIIIDMLFLNLLFTTIYKSLLHV